MNDDSNNCYALHGTVWCVQVRGAPEGSIDWNDRKASTTVTTLRNVTVLTAILILIVFAWASAFCYVFVRY